MLNDDEFTRTDEFFSSSGVRCAATVYRPTAPTGQVPVIVMAHGFGGIRGIRLPAYAARFASDGYAVVLFDYRYFGDSEGEPRQLLDVPSQLDDWRAAIRFARSLDVVDAERVVGWGTSFAGGHVLSLAGGGERLAAIVAQVPHVSGPAAVRATGLRQALRLTPIALADLFGSFAGRPPRYVEAIGSEGSVAALASPGAIAGFTRLIAESGLQRGDYPETVAARILVKIGLYSPARTARKITCAALIQVASEDNIAPAAAAVKVADVIPRSTLRRYDCGHFDPYVDPYFPTVVADQLAFLQEAVPVGPRV
ncbi:alpha/beta hydrolase [Williamsia maris]|uniref:X-Pro dipeptidyl-peptidase (S15 family) n=1 Tax=Williamsia maris TaxID=72806 RepID=A0ABT1HJR3_9NOCA|nr:alpha/beta fold hydrolase [Williamsia maris]MCP2178162.1 X-Pro dipeptidyl-peptidase (S15 family) [Williamsia maris]